MGTEPVVVILLFLHSFRTIINYMGTELEPYKQYNKNGFRTIINYMGTEYCCNENMNWF